MTCERTEFVTNYYKDTVNVAKFERLLNVSVRKHIRQHILPSVRVAYKMFLRYSDCVREIINIKYNTLALLC